jgi:hypothetical protein
MSAIKKPLPVICDSPDSIRNLLEMYSHEGNTPYIRIHTWGVAQNTKTIELFIQEVLKGEASLNLEPNPIDGGFRLIRDLVGTITIRITRHILGSPSPVFLQEFRRQPSGKMKKRKHRHSSISEKLSRAESNAMGLSESTDWRVWWENLASKYKTHQVSEGVRQGILVAVRRAIGEELGLTVSDEDIGPKNLSLVPLTMWGQQDQLVEKSESDGTHSSDSYPGIWTRNPILPMIWNMPTYSSLGHILWREEGYEESGTNHVTRWHTGHRN